MKQNILSCIQGFYLAEVAYHFQANGLFARLSRGRTPKQLAKEFGYDQQLLTALLEFVYQSSDILARDLGGTYTLSHEYRDYGFLGFQLDKFIGAYGPTALNLDRSLRSSDLGRRLVNRATFAQAYLALEPPPNAIVVQLAHTLKLRSILDLGCGPATLLSELCRDRKFRGWGMDESSAMCRIARRRIVQAGLQKRVRIFHADVRDLARHLKPYLRSHVEAVHCKDLFNELFLRGNTEAVRYLSKLKSWFPGRLLFVVDYYGKLTSVSHIPQGFRHTLIHDLIQFLSAQGVPPANFKQWAEIYQQAGCIVEHASEGKSQGIEWFVHVVRL